MNPRAITPRAISMVAALALALTACGSPADSDGSAATAPVSVSESSVTASSVSPAPTGDRSTEPFSVVSDVVYMTVEGRDVSMDIYTPAEDAPWPVVVAFHGLGTKNDDTTTAIAEAAAAAGMIVFAPTWVDEHSFPVTLDSFDLWRREASCSVAFAQQYTRQVGGDPSPTVLYGFSAGVGPTLFASLQPITEPIDGCMVDEPLTAASGVVLGDGEYLLYSENFDAVFQTDAAAMQHELGSMVDPGRWPSDLDAKFYLWVAEDGVPPRRVGDPGAGWLALRDPDGSILADLERLGELEDGTVGTVDSGRLLETRLADAGLDVSFTSYPGGHTTLNKVQDLVSYLQAAAGG
jgi:acetyl esterase/lipase